MGTKIKCYTSITCNKKTDSYGNPAGESVFHVVFILVSIQNQTYGQLKLNFRNLSCSIIGVK